MKKNKDKKKQFIIDALNDTTLASIGGAINYKSWAEKLVPIKVYEGKGFL